MRLRPFLASESGAVAVDWIVTTVAVLGLSLAITSQVSDAVEELARDLSDALSRIEIETAF